MAKSGEGVPLIRGRCEGSNPSAPTCFKHNEQLVLVGAKQTRYKCASCNREYQAKWYKDNKAVQLERVANNNRKVRQRNAQFIWEYKVEHPCVDCGEDDPIVLDFDHRDQSNKEFGVTTAVKDKSIKVIQQEIDKCDIRCANCHRRRTAGQLGWYKAIRR